jgi:holo-[acyl-carrier protein] synthase
LIVGIGVDLIKIQRIKEALDRSGMRFLEKVFTPKEIELASKGEDRAAYFATRFAAKESVLKAFCTGWAGVKGTDIHIEPGARGEPLVKLSGGLAEMASQRGVTRVLVSLSYDSEYAIAMCILLGSRP